MAYRRKSAAKKKTDQNGAVEAGDGARAGGYTEGKRQRQGDNGGRDAAVDVAFQVSERKPLISCMQTV